MTRFTRVYSGAASGAPPRFFFCRLALPRKLTQAGDTAWRVVFDYGMAIDGLLQSDGVWDLPPPRPD